jgi:hypothetical protein
MFPLPESLVVAIKEFEQSKNTSGAVSAAIERASLAIDEYGGFLLRNNKLPPTDGFVGALLRQKQMLVRAQQTGELSELWQFNPTMQLQAMVMGNEESWRAVALPVLPLDELRRGGEALRARILRLCECGGGSGVMMPGSMLPHRLRRFSPVDNAQLIHALVSAGLGYAGTGSAESLQEADSSLVGLNGHKRAALFLLMKPCLPARLLSRRKDCCRQLRKFARERPGGKLSLKCDSLPIEKSVEMLRQHHSENNWVEANIVAAWKELSRQGKFCVMELFEGLLKPFIFCFSKIAKKDDLLIAADFCHLIDGGSGFNFV